MNILNRLLLVFAIVIAAQAVTAASHPTPGIAPGSGARYATDAYPGFDSEDDIVNPSRKEPRWFAFINGPNRGNAAEQYAYCQELVLDGSHSKACKQLDALVREWPTAPEAAKAQEQLADLLYRQEQDYEEAFAAYRYLLDFYSLQCNYDVIADRLYELAGVLNLEGKAVIFVRFDNTVDVRRAYEACVLHAPGAAWVPEAMLTIGSLREDEGKYVEAVKVYENLRNLHPESEQSKTAIVREAEVRMKVLRDHKYNRARCQDTIDYLRLALKNCRPEDVSALSGHLAEAQGMIAEEAYLGAKFYDTPMRTRRSAVNAYERFLRDYPESAHAEEVRERIEELKGVEP